MRLIKFRAFLKKEKMMVPVLELMNNGRAGVSIQDSGPFIKQPEDIEVMQFTGLIDKEGKEIYEGDIYSQGDDNIRYTVMFIDCQFIGRQVGNRSLAGLTYFADDIEVIGNIHESPDLLK